VTSRITCSIIFLTIIPLNHKLFNLILVSYGIEFVSMTKVVGPVEKD
jgi:hypothetical protein